MPEENHEQFLKSILDNFRRYSRDGEILTLDGENVVYNYIRSNQDPSYVGTLHDKRTFRKSVLIELIDKTFSSPNKQASITTESLKEEFDDSGSIDTGSKLGNVPQYNTEVELELKIEGDIPIFRTSDMWPMQHLKIR